MSDWEDLGRFRQVVTVVLLIGAGLTSTLIALNVYVSRVTGIVSGLGVFGALLLIVLTTKVASNRPPRHPPPAAASARRATAAVHVTDSEDVSVERVSSSGYDHAVTFDGVSRGEIKDVDASPTRKSE